MTAPRQVLPGASYLVTRRSGGSQERGSQLRPPPERPVQRLHEPRGRAERRVEGGGSPDAGLGPGAWAASLVRLARAHFPALEHLYQTVDDSQFVERLVGMALQDPTPQGPQRRDVLSRGH